MSNELARQMAGLQPGDHLCLVYDHDDTLMATVTSYIAAGLRRGASCLYVAEAPAAAAAAQALAAAGVDVPEARRRGALALVPAAEVHLRHGGFDPVAIHQFVGASTRQALDAGFTGLWVVGDMAFALEPTVGRARLREYEFLLNERFPHQRLVGLCAYDRRRFPPEVLHDMLRCHEGILAGARLCRPNPYRERPGLMLDDAYDADRVAWMLEQLQRFQAALHAHDAFQTEAAHDLRTPLTNIMARSQLVQRRLARDGAVDTAWLSAQLSTVSESGARMRRLVDEMSDVAHLRMGHALDLRLEPVDVGELIRLAAEALPVAQEPAVVVDAPDGAVVVADRERLDRVVRTIIGNAVKYGLEHLPVEATVRRSDHGVTITVRDRGVGIPAGDLPRIFTHFYRASNALGPPGAGIGLAGARMIVAQHGGELTLTSVLGAGTTVEIALPYDAPHAGRAVRAPFDATRSAAPHEPTPAQPV